MLESKLDYTYTRRDESERSPSPRDHFERACLFLTANLFVTFIGLTYLVNRFDPIPAIPTSNTCSIDVFLSQPKREQLLQYK